MEHGYRTAEFLAKESRKGKEYDELGRQVVLALLTQPRWITRTVESVRFVDRNVVSRRVVRHFVIPKDEDARPIVNDRYAMPIYAVRKGEFDGGRDPHHRLADAGAVGHRRVLQQTTPPVQLPPLTRIG